MRKKGVALVIVLMVATVLIVFGSFMVSQSTVGLQLVRNEHELAVASYAAQAGLAVARNQLALNPNWGTGTGNATTTVYDQVPFLSQSDPNEVAAYSVDVTNNFNGRGTLTPLSAGVRLPTGVQVPVETVFLTATGYAHGGQVSKHLTQMVFIDPGGQFNMAVLSRGAVTFVSNGNTAVTGTPLQPGDPAYAGIISLSGPVQLISNDVVGGAVAVPGANPALVQLGLGSNIGGGIQPVPAVLPNLAPRNPAGGLPDPTSPSVTAGGLIQPGVYGDLSLSGGTNVQLTPGEYVFSNVSLSGGSTVQIAGSASTRIYFTGSFTMSGGSYLQNPSGLSSNLQLCEAGSPGPGRQVVMNSDNGATACTIFAPDCHVTLLPACNLLGAIVSSDFTAAPNANITYDSNLAAPGTPAILILYTNGN